MKSRPSLLISSIPIALLIALLSINRIEFGDNGLEFSNQIAILLSAGLAGVIGRLYKVPFTELMEGTLENIKTSVPAVLVLLMIGCLASSWLISGVVPAMIYYGLEILNPNFFLVTTCLICCLVSLSTGSSWGTIATVGIALLGIGKALEINEGLIAGAIISGAYFGDKMSPMSDTTNLAPAVSGTDLISHIRYMMITTIPSIGITLIIFLVIGLAMDSSASFEQVNEITKALEQKFNLSPILFIVPLTVISLIIRRIPAVPSLAIGSLLAILFMFLFQSALIEEILNSNKLNSAYSIIITTLGNGVSIPSDNALLNDLLSSSGMKGMLDTIWLILCAMVFGGTMEKSGSLHTITESLLRLAKGRASLIGTTAMSSVFMNFTASDQYLAIVVPGKMFASAYRKMGLHPVNLSRTLEDAGTVTSVLIPWNTCGATQAGVLGIATAVYWPYCFFCIISPVMTVLVASLGYKIRMLEK